MKCYNFLAVLLSRSSAGKVRPCAIVYKKDSKMGKNKFSNKNLGKWKPVRIGGCIDAENLEGLIGLEVLENYNPSFLSGKSKNKEYRTNELDGDIFDGVSKKRKTSDESDDESSSGSEQEEKEEQVKEKQPKKKKLKKTNEESYPGKFVLLKPPENLVDEDFFASKENSDAKTAWSTIQVTSNEILRALIESKFYEPTEIQQLTIPVSAFGKYDILAASETGSGKSLAFLLPILQNIQRTLIDKPDKSEDLFSLILTPTRELAQQIYKHLEAVSKYTDVTSACIIGGLATVKQERVLNSSPNIVIGTPGRIWEMFKDGNKHLQKIVNVRYLVIDETDRMIEKGHFAELEEILELLTSSEANPKRQTFVFSATLTMVHELPDYIAKKRKKSITPSTLR